MRASTAPYAAVPGDLPDGLAVRPLTFIDNLNFMGGLAEAMQGRDAGFDALARSRAAYLGARWVGLPLYYHWACSGYGAFEGERLAGSLHLRGWRQALHVSALAVRPEYRRRGLGRALLRLAERQARRLGRAWLSLRVTPGNEPAVRLYEAEGYRRAGQRALRLDGRALAGGASGGVGLRPLSGPGARAAYRAFTRADLADGDAWAADILAAQAAGQPLSRGRRRWLCRVDGRGVGYLALGGPLGAPRLYLASQARWWGTREERAWLGAALAGLPEPPGPVTLCLPSQGHYQASARSLADLDPAEQPLAWMSMLKPLASPANSQGMDSHNGR